MSFYDHNYLPSLTKYKLCSTSALHKCLDLLFVFKVNNDLVGFDKVKNYLRLGMYLTPLEHRVFIPSHIIMSTFCFTLLLHDCADSGTCFRNVSEISVKLAS